MKRYHTQIPVPVMLTPNEVENVLSELCKKYGFCLPGDEIERLAANPPTDIETFTAAALSAEGYCYAKSDPLCVKAREIVAKAFVSHYTNDLDQESLGTQIWAATP